MTAGHGHAAPPRTDRLFTRSDHLLALLVGLLAFVLYARTLARGVLGWDSAECQVLAYQVGIAHLGYPVYTLLAKLFITLVPVGGVAYRVNLFSAFLGALCVAGVYLNARLVSKSRLAATVAALALTVSFTLWSQSIIAEKYSAVGAFLVALWLALLIWYRTGSGRALFAAGVVGGLGLGVHGTFSVVAPAVGLFLLLNWRRWKEFLAPAVLGAVAGVILFLVAFFAVDLNAPPANIWAAQLAPARSAWGLSEADVENPLARAVFILSARQWRPKMFLDPVRDVLAKTVWYRGNIRREFSLPIAALALAGLILLLLHDWRLGVLHGTALAAHAGFYFNYSVGDMYKFFVPSYVWLAILAAVGVGGLERAVATLSARPVRLGLRVIMIAALLYAAVVPILSPYWRAVTRGEVPFRGQAYYGVSHRTERSYRVAFEVVKALEPHAILFQDWTSLYQYWYAAHIEQGRTDLRFIEQNPFHAPSRDFPASTIEFIRANVDRYPIYLAKEQPELRSAGFTMRAVDLGRERLYRVERP